MAFKGNSSECSVEQSPKQYPKYYVSNIPKFLTQIAIRTYFEKSVGEVLDVELLGAGAALVTFNSLQESGMSSPHHIAGKKLSILHLLTEQTTLQIFSPAAAALGGEVEQLAKKWNLTILPQGDSIIITGHCDCVCAFRADLDGYVKEKLVSPSDPNIQSIVDQAGGSYPQPQPTKVIHSSVVSGTSDGFCHETQASDAESTKLSTDMETKQVFSNLSPDALALLEKNSEEEMPGVRYNTKAGIVQIEGQSKSELEDRISRFQSAYQSILTPRRLKAEPVQVPSALDETQVTSMVASFNERYTQCVFIYCEGPPRVVRVVSISSRQFDQAKKLLIDALYQPPTTTPTSFSNLEVISLPNDRKLTLKKADIVQENVHVIVNAANKDLLHGGGVAGALNKASHGNLQRYSSAYVNRQGTVPVGRVVVTHGGGALKCQIVIHAVGPDSSYAPPDCRRLIAQVINQSLTQAEKHNFTSIAIPAISSGIFGVNKHLVATCVIETILSHQFTKPTPTLSDIRIVIIDDTTYNCFAQHFVQKRAQLLDHVAPKQPPESQSAGVGKLIDIEPEVPYQPPTVPANQNSKLNILDQPPPLEDAGQSGAAEQDSNPITSFVSPDPTGHATPINEESKQSLSTEEGHSLTSEDIPNVVTCLNAVKYKWELLAIQLGLDSSTCGTLKVEHFSTSKKLEKMLTVWLQRTEAPPTLEVLASALASQAVKEHSLAKALPGLFQQARTRYPSLPPPTVSNPNSSPKGGAMAPNPQLGTTNLQLGEIGAVTKAVPPVSSGAETKPEGNEVALGNDPLSATDRSTDQPHGYSPSVHSTTNTVNVTSTKVTYSQAAGGSTSTTSASSGGGKVDPKTIKPATGGMPHHIKAGKTAGGHDGKSKPASTKDTNCSICLEPFKHPTNTKCGHTFCSQCIRDALHHSPYCPSCRKPLRQIMGNQPPGTMTHKVLYHQSLPGYTGYNTIEITYQIPNGTQGPQHPNPGQRYSGALRVAYLPDNSEGREVLQLLRKAFNARLIFTIGQSVTSGQKNTVVWNDIHHKTNWSGGQQGYGYPDKTYLQRVKEDLAAKGIVPHESSGV